jgi:hypothetical protein
MMDMSMNVNGKDMGGVVPEREKQKLPCKPLIAHDGVMQILSYEELLTSFRKGLRNGNWRKLNFLDKALYRASLWYAKHRGSIVNAALVEKLFGLVERLKETKGMKIFKKGFKKAVEMLEKSKEGEGVFTWAPQLKNWLKDPDYIFWLGAMR